MANPFEVQVVNPLQSLLLGQQQYDAAGKRQAESAKLLAGQEAAQLWQQGDKQGALSRLLGSGNYDGAAAYGVVDQRDYSRGRDTILDQRHSTERAQDVGFRNRTLSIQERAAARADEGPLEKAGQREAVLRRYGIDPSSPEGRAYTIGGEWAGPGAGGASLNPVYGVGADGKPAIVQLTKTGVPIQTKLPDGFQISKDPIRIDSGTHWTLLDPQTRQQVGTLPKNLSAVEVAKAEGEATGAAQIALPTVISNSQQILKTLEGIENHPGKKYSLGMGSKIPTIPGTSQADFRANMDQLNGQTFLQAFQTLKGGGAITDIEGQKGSNAIARMQTSQSAESFDAALKDFKDVVKAGMLRASAKARGPGAKTQGITQQQYEALPPGSPFTAPDGTQRIKP